MHDCDVIDFVMPWVDDSDPSWIHKKEKYLGENTANGNDEARFRDWDILRYWFRAVEQYAPWVRYIFFVTDNQMPVWLNDKHPKLKWIKHTDYIPTEYLPTFSANPIELNFHRIPELAEQFVYFNDDVFLNAPTTPADFFRNGFPCHSAILDTMSPVEAGDAFTHINVNDIAFVNTHFDKHEVLKNNIKLWFSPIYGKDVLRNIYHAFTKNFSAFRLGHISASMLKSTYKTVWALEPRLLHDTSSNKFRALSDVNQYIMSYYDICSGRFVPRSLNFGRCYGIERDNEQMYEDIRFGRHKVVCINDHPNITDFEREKKVLLEIMEDKFPHKCSFEK